MLSRRSDLAMEAKKIWSEDNPGALQGVDEDVETRDGFQVVTVTIKNADAAASLGKPCGKYVTVELGRFLRREDDSFEDGARVLAQVLRDLLGSVTGTVLVAGLGNPAITPDAIGHLVVKNTLVTRHLLERCPDQFQAFGSVAAVEPGVLGTTGVESVDTVGAIVREIRPAAVIAVDALASRSMERLCRTVQIADTGIVPGSGVGNARAALSRETLGVPVIALGVPTVVDAVTLAMDMAQSAGAKLDGDALRQSAGSMIVTPKEIDSNAAAISRLVGYGINLAMHDGLTVEDIDMFLG